MKPKVLLIYIDVSAKEGIIPYLSSIFHSYLDFEYQMIHEVDPDQLECYQMILLSSQLCKKLVYDSICHLNIPVCLCKRALNLSYIHRILEIPAFSKVCIINDRKKNCEAIQTELINLGFTSFQYEIYYPEAPLIDPAIQYGITPGESRYAPTTMKHIIDIGNRVVDISTLCQITMHFQLPEDILNQVSHIFFNYIGNFVRFTNRHLENITERSLNTTRILDSLGLGVCVTSEDGRIVRSNKAFSNLLGIRDLDLVERSLIDILTSFNIQTTLEELVSSTTLLLENPQGMKFSCCLSGNFLSVKQKLCFVFIASPNGECVSSPIYPQKLLAPPQFRQTAQPDIFRLLLQNTKFSKMIEQAKLYANSPACILLLGSCGLYQQALANMIHSCSPHGQMPFAQVDARTPEYVKVSDSLGAPSCTVNLEEFIANCHDGTVYIENIEHASPSFQSFLCQHLRAKERHAFFLTVSSQEKLRLICSASSLDALSDPQRFIPELFYRINSLPLQIPNLKDLRDELPTFYQYYLDKFLNHPGIQPNDIFSAKLLHFLLFEYEYPGNFPELESICLYFSCNYTGKKLTLDNLPPHIHIEASENPLSLTAQETEILAIIKKYPHSGRNRILSLLAEQGAAISSNQIRALLSVLNEKGYIQILKTKQGCIITELGAYVLAQSTANSE